MVFSAFVTPATPRTPAGGRACGTPRLIIGGLLFRPRLSADTLGFAQFPPLTSVNFAGSRYKKIPCAGASGAERTARANGRNGRRIEELTRPTWHFNIRGARWSPRHRPNTSGGGSRGWSIRGKKSRWAMWHSTHKLWCLIVVLCMFVGAGGGVPHS